MPAQRLQGSLEENVLTLLCWNDTYAAGLAIRLRAELFSTKHYREIAEKSITYIEKFGRAPRSHIRDLLESIMRRGDEGKLLHDTIEAMEGLAPDIQPDYVLGELDRFIDIRTMSIALENAHEALAAGDLETARESVYSTTNRELHTDGIWLADHKQMLSFMNVEETDFFSSGVDALDDRGIRPERETLFVGMAPPKKGKSWWLIEIGKRNALLGHSVLHITLEMSEQKTAQRYVQSLFALTKSKATTLRVATMEKTPAGSLLSLDQVAVDAEAIGDKTKAKIIKGLNRFKKKKPFLIKGFPSGSLTPGQLVNYLEMLKRVHNFVPDLILLDYGDLMAVDLRDKRASVGNNFVKLRGISQTHKCAMVTATQGNRESDTAKLVTKGNVSEDWSKVMTADTFLTYNQTAPEKKSGLARIFAAAVRGEEDGIIIMITQSYATGQFCLDSVYMDRDAEDLADNFSKEN